MKNNANIVFLFLFIFFSEFLSGQNPIEFKDFLGIQEQSCKDEVIESAIGLREKLTNNGSGVYIALANVYAPSVYMNKVEGLNAMEKVTLDHLNSNHQNYIVYLAKVNDENGSIDIKLHFKLASDKYHNGCLDRLDLVKNHINKTLKDEVNKDGVRIADIGCIVNKSMSEFSEFLGSGCANNQEIINTWFLTNEFENIQLPGFTLDYGNPERGIQELISSSRSFCSMIIDYTQGELKCEIGNTGLVAMNEFLSGVQLPSSFRIIITDKYIAPELLTQIEDQEYNSSEGPFCEAVVWFHFTEKFQGEGDQVFIKVDRKDNAECYEGCFTYEELKTKYKSSSPPFSNIKSIDWRLYQYKDQIIDIIKSGEGLGLDFQNQQQLEYYAGIVSGYTDALIDDIDFISLIMQMTYDFGSEYAPWSIIWWSETIIRVNNKRNLYNAICEKWDDTYEFWKSLSNNAMVFMHPVTSQTVINAMFPTFVVIMDRVFVQVLDGIKDWRDKIIFKEGSFEAGYAQGQLLTILIPGGALFKGISKGTKVIRESKNVIGELTEHIAKQIDDDAAKAIGEKIAISLPDLYKKLGPNTKVWFKGNMPSWIIRRLATMSDEALVFFEDAITRFPNLKSEWINTPKMFTFAENLQKDWWAKYGLGGLSKRTNGGITTEMKKLIGETEVVTNGIKTKLKQFTIGDEAAGTIGRAFDDEIIGRLKNSFGSGDFSNFPPSVRTSFQDAYNQGYKLVTNEPRLSINGQNFDPDILFVKTNVVQGITVTDIKYIDVKYLDDVPFNSGGQSAVKAAVLANGSTTVVNTTNANLFDEIAQAAIPNTSGNLTITSVEKLSIQVSDLGIIIQ